MVSSVKINGTEYKVKSLSEKQVSYVNSYRRWKDQTKNIVIGYSGKQFDIVIYCFSSDCVNSLRNLLSGLNTVTLTIDSTDYTCYIRDLSVEYSNYKYMVNISLIEVG